MTNLNGCTPHLTFETYSSKDPEINLSMQYISGWQSSEHRGSNNSYAQVLFYEKASSEKQLSAIIAVTVRNKKGEKTDDSNTIVDDLISKRLKFKDAKLESKTQGTVLGAPSVIIDLTYKTLDKLYSTDAKFVPVKEKIIVAIKENTLYTIRYENAAERFSTYESAFNHIVKTITIKKTH
ncbi:MAG: PsbP-related protein [Candidatus Omnitrophica bacterium]|nr:PsbP-related protein [Candidatus Omnitrophota bacterium]